MPPKTPEQLEEEFRRSQQRQQRPQGMQPAPGVMPQGARPAQVQQPASLATRPDEPTPVAPQPEEQAKAGPTGFVGFGQYQAANVGAAERMAQAVGQQAMATGTAGLVGTEAGRQALLQRAFGSASELDAALAGAAAPSYLQQLEAEYGPAAQQRREQQRREAFARSAQMQQEQAARDAKVAAEAQQRVSQSVDASNNRVRDEAARIRQEDSRRPRGQMGAERWANLNGLTLEQWILRGKQPAL